MFDRIRFTLRRKSVHVSCDPLFITAHTAYHGEGNDIHILERNFEGFDVTEPISIYDNYKGLQYNITKDGEAFTLTIEEMSLNNLLNLGLPREALDETIILQKRLLNPR